MKIKLTPLLLIRIAIAFIFVVFGIWETLVPAYWAQYVPSFVVSILNPLFATRVHGLILIILGSMTLVGYKKKIIAPLTFLTLLSVVISVFIFGGFSDILVRDIVILICSASLLFEIEKKKQE